MSATYGKLDNQNDEYGVDIIRFNLASDSIVDTAGVLGTPGAIVCRAKCSTPRTSARQPGLPSSRST
jgi:hypothetical protein